MIIKTAADMIEYYHTHIEQTIDVTDLTNGTGYFDPVVKVPGQGIAKFTDAHNRKGVVLFTTQGNLVMFQRYTNGERGAVVYNAPQWISRLIPSGSMDSILVEHLINYNSGYNSTTNVYQQTLDHLAKLTEDALA